MTVKPGSSLVSISVSSSEVTLPQPLSAHQGHSGASREARASSVSSTASCAGPKCLRACGVPPATAAQYRGPTEDHPSSQILLLPPQMLLTSCAGGTEAKRLASAIPATQSLPCCLLHQIRVLRLNTARLHRETFSQK